MGEIIFSVFTGVCLVVAGIILSANLSAEQKKIKEPK